MDITEIISQTTEEPTLQQEIKESPEAFVENNTEEKQAEENPEQIFEVHVSADVTRPDKDNLEHKTYANIAAVKKSEITSKQQDTIPQPSMTKEHVNIRIEVVGEQHVEYEPLPTDPEGFTEFLTKKERRSRSRSRTKSVTTVECEVEEPKDIAGQEANRHTLTTDEETETPTRSIKNRGKKSNDKSLISSEVPQVTTEVLESITSLQQEESPQTSPKKSKRRKSKDKSKAATAASDPRKSKERSEVSVVEPPTPKDENVQTTAISTENKEQQTSPKKSKKNKRGKSQEQAKISEEKKVTNVESERYDHDLNVSFLVNERKDILKQQQIETTATVKEEQLSPKKTKARKRDKSEDTIAPAAVELKSIKDELAKEDHSLQDKRKVFEITLTDNAQQKEGTATSKDTPESLETETLEKLQLQEAESTREEKTLISTEGKVEEAATAVLKGESTSVEANKKKRREKSKDKLASETELVEVSVNEPVNAREEVITCPVEIPKISEELQLKDFEEKGSSKRSKGKGRKSKERSEVSVVEPPTPKDETSHAFLETQNETIIEQSDIPLTIASEEQQISPKKSKKGKLKKSKDKSEEIASFLKAERIESMPTDSEVPQKEKVLQKSWASVAESPTKSTLQLKTEVKTGTELVDSATIVESIPAVPEIPVEQEVTLQPGDDKYDKKSKRKHKGKPKDSLEKGGGIMGILTSVKSAIKGSKQKESSPEMAGQHSGTEEIPISFGKPKKEKRKKKEKHEEIQQSLEKELPSEGSITATDVTHRNVESEPSDPMNNQINSELRIDVIAQPEVTGEVSTTSIVDVTSSTPTVMIFTDINSFLENERSASFPEVRKPEVKEAAPIASTEVTGKRGSFLGNLFSKVTGSKGDEAKKKQKAKKKQVDESAEIQCELEATKENRDEGIQVKIKKPKKKKNRNRTLSDSLTESEEEDGKRERRRSGVFETLISKVSDALRRKSESPEKQEVVTVERIQQTAKSADLQPSSETTFVVSNILSVVTKNEKPSSRQKSPEIEDNCAIPVEYVPLAIDELPTKEDLFVRHLKQDGPFWLNKFVYDEAEENYQIFLAKINKSVPAQIASITSGDHSPDKDGDSDSSSGRGSPKHPQPDNQSSSSNAEFNTQFTSADLPGGICRWKDESTYLSPEPLTMKQNEEVSNREGLLSEVPAYDILQMLEAENRWHQRKILEEVEQEVVPLTEKDTALQREDLNKSVGDKVLASTVNTNSNLESESKFVTLKDKPKSQKYEQTNGVDHLHTAQRLSESIAEDVISDLDDIVHFDTHFTPIPTLGPTVQSSTAETTRQFVPQAASDVSISLKKTLTEDVQELGRALQATEISAADLPAADCHSILLALMGVTGDLKRHAAEAIRLENLVLQLSSASDNDAQTLAAQLAGIRTRIATLLSQAENGTVAVEAAQKAQVKRQEQLTQYHQLLLEIELWLQTTRETLAKEAQSDSVSEIQKEIAACTKVNQELADKEQQLAELTSVCEEFRRYPDLKELSETLLEHLQTLILIFTEHKTILKNKIEVLTVRLVEVQEQVQRKQATPDLSQDNTLDSSSMPVEEIPVLTDTKKISTEFVLAEREPVGVSIETQTGKSLTSPPPVVLEEVEPKGPVDAQIQTQSPIENIPETKEAITISKLVSGDQETIQIATKPIISWTKSDSSGDLLVEADYRTKPEMAEEAPLKSTELNILHSKTDKPFETVMVEPDEATTEVIVDSDGTKRIIVKKLQRTVVSKQQTHQQQRLTTMSTLTEGTIPVSQSFSQVTLQGQQSSTTIARGDGMKEIMASQNYGGKVICGVPGGQIDVQEIQSEPEHHYTVVPGSKPTEVEVQGTKLHEGDVTFVDNQNTLVPIEGQILQQGEEIRTSSSTVRAVVQQVTRKVIRKTRRIIRRMVIVDGKEQITEEVVEEPEEVEVTEEGIPRVSINVTSTQDGEVVQEQQFGEAPSFVQSQPGVTVTRTVTSVLLGPDGKPLESLPENVTVLQHPDERYVVEQATALESSPAPIITEPVEILSEKSPDIKTTSVSNIISEFIEREKSAPSSVDSSRKVDQASSSDLAPSAKPSKKKKEPKSPKDESPIEEALKSTPDITVPAKISDSLPTTVEVPTSPIPLEAAVPTKTPMVTETTTISSKESPSVSCAVIGEVKESKNVTATKEIASAQNRLEEHKKLASATISEEPKIKEYVTVTTTKEAFAQPAEGTEINVSLSLTEKVEPSALSSVKTETDVRFPGDTELAVEAVETISPTEQTILKQEIVTSLAAPTPETIVADTKDAATSISTSLKEDDTPEQISVIVTKETTIISSPGESTIPQEEKLMEIKNISDIDVTVPEEQSSVTTTTTQFILGEQSQKLKPVITSSGTSKPFVSSPKSPSKNESRKKRKRKHPTASHESDLEDKSHSPEEVEIVTTVVSKQELPEVVEIPTTATPQELSIKEVEPVIVEISHHYSPHEERSVEKQLELITEVGTQYSPPKGETPIATVEAQHKVSPFIDINTQFILNEQLQPHFISHKPEQAELINSSTIASEDRSQMS